MCNLIVILLLLNLQVFTSQALCNRTDRSFTTFHSNTTDNPGQFNLHHQHEQLEQEQSLLDKLRLEYYKYRIVSNLDINTNPDNLNPDLDQELRDRIKLSRNNSNKQKFDTPMINLRQKRSLSCSEVKSDKNACCLETFYVNFTEIGWDKWIIYPTGYNANYCRGQCDLSHARYYHSTLLSKFSSVIGLCCSPRQMAPLELLYMDEGKVFKKIIPDMIVESCDCA